MHGRAALQARQNLRHLAGGTSVKTPSMDRVLLSTLQRPAWERSVAAGPAGTATGGGVGGGRLGSGGVVVVAPRGLLKRPVYSQCQPDISASTNRLEGWVRSLQASAPLGVRAEDRGRCPLLRGPDGPQPISTRLKQCPLDREVLSLDLSVRQSHLDRDTEEFSNAELMALGALSRILASRYTDELREQMGGTYGVSASASARNRLVAGRDRVAARLRISDLAEEQSH